MNANGQTADVPVEAVLRTPPKRSVWVDAWKRLKRQRAAMVGGSLVALFIVIGLLAPVLAPYDPTAQDLSHHLQPASAQHWLGTDEAGRDELSRLLYGARISLTIGFFSVVSSLIVGALLGLVAGFFGGWADVLISRVFDVMLAFPSILLAIAIVAILGPGLFNALLAVAIINVPTYGRLIRSRVLSVKQEEYVLACRALGMSNARLLFRHVLPNSWAPLIVQATLGIGTAILDAAALGFLGLGAQPPSPEWGKMLSDAKDYISNAPWIVAAPGIAIALSVLGFNLFGDGLRDALDPKMK
ncbi:nickel transporter permease [Alicyclobacillus macrosporangiidus]|uniref:Peptide/nickel transport system permease protein n=1 Tax=Alicyclobacillus macrosporangiidus TaxID=392015 RepID=A0A1I7J1Q6_9BACL|nr:nickel transporter permease [Alicyclobacillus macrosporangiidus]SFU79077.1 peptide/nickel transport system permease protein [Alicyclobacillus macrosporangiidus]